MPDVPIPGSPTYSEPLQRDDAANHPALQNTGPDSPARFEDSVGFQIAAENVAEVNGISLAEAKRQITAGADDSSNYVRPRSETALGEAGWAKWQSPSD